MLLGLLMTEFLINFNSVIANQSSNKPLILTRATKNPEICLTLTSPIGLTPHAPVAQKIADQR